MPVTVKTLTNEPARSFVFLFHFWQTEHLFPIAEIALRHGVSIDTGKPGNSKGLDSAVAAQRLIENGPNILSPPKQISPFMKFIHCLTSLFNLLLILAGILNYILLGVDPKDNKVNVSSAQLMQKYHIPFILCGNGAHCSPE